MYCKKAILVNWGNIPHLEFDFGPVNLFSGGNGSGKTTAADALQALMTAAHENLFSFNPGQDESTQRSRGKNVRTLASYILGCDDGSYSRPRPTDGYIAAVFHPTEGEDGEVFTAVMCVRASLDTAGAKKQARQDSLMFMILPGEALTLAHFVRHDTAGKYVVPQPDIAKLLENEFGKNSVEVFDKKGPYLRSLYGAMRGLRKGVSDREAKHAARTFANFMAYKPVKSINEFVAKEVLEPRDLSDDIKQVSELMKTIHSMEDETRQLKQSLENLNKADEDAASYIDHWSAHCVDNYSEISRQLLVKQADYLKSKENQRAMQEAISETEVRISGNDNKKQALHDQLVSLQAQRQGISALKDKDQLERDVESAKKQLAETAKPLLEQNHQITENFNLSQSLKRQLNSSSIAVDIPALENKKLRKIIADVIDAGQDSGIDSQRLFNADWVGIADLESRLDDLIELETLHRDIVSSLHDAGRLTAGQSVRDQVLGLLQQRQKQRGDLQQKLQLKQTEIQRLENHAVSYPAYVEQAVLAIKQQCPQARPAVLCDFIEIIDPKWQMAIEGYIGGNRFGILVEPEYEAEAIRIVRNMKGRRNNAKVIQGSKAMRDAGRVSPARDSIVELMQFEHKIAEFYIKASYGSVLQVSNEEDLRQTGRGLMARGLGSGGYSMFRCDIDDADLVFGQGARERALTAKQHQLEQIVNQANVIDEQYRSANNIYDIIEKLKFVSCSQHIKTMLDVFRKMQQAEHQLQSLDLSEFDDLEVALDKARAEHDETEQAGKSLQQEKGRLANAVEKLSEEIKRLANDVDAVQEVQEKHEKAVLSISAVYVDFDSEKALIEAEQQAQKAMASFTFDEQIKTHAKLLEEHERELYRVVSDHNMNSSSYNKIAYIIESNQRHDSGFFKSIVTIKRDIQSIYNGLKNNVLVDKHEKLSSLKDSFNTAFVTNLCHSIYQSINEGKRVLDDLNKELEHHRFGADQERFFFGYSWVPEFKEYQRFFKEVIDMPNLGDGAGLFDSELSEKSCQVRDKLLSMLLDKDEQVAQRDLQRLSDYRNYREYEIYKEPLNKEAIALSTYGTGSGGQLETPAYIIRSAAVTSAFKFNEGSTHCRMVLVDEAFSKMDETRSREVINYLTETLGLQLLFIMPTSKSGPFMDLISNQTIFSKCPTTEKIGELNTRVLVDRKVCNQEKIKELWANHRHTVRHQGMLDFMEEFV